MHLRSVLGRDGDGVGSVIRNITRISGTKNRKMSQQVHKDANKELEHLWAMPMASHKWTWGECKGTYLMSKSTLDLVHAQLYFILFS